MTHEEGVLVRVLEQLGRDVVEALAPPTFRRRLLQWWRARRRPTLHTYGPHARFVGLTDRELAEWREDLDAQARRHVREVERQLEGSRTLDVPDEWLEVKRRQY